MCKRKSPQRGNGTGTWLHGSGYDSRDNKEAGVWLREVAEENKWKRVFCF